MDPRLLACSLVSLLLPFPPRSAPTTPLAIANAGFEDLYFGSNLPAMYGGDVPPGTFPTGPPPAGWVAWSETGAPPPGTFLGVLNPGTAALFAPDPCFFDDGAPEGDNAVLSYTSGDAGGPEYGVEQTLSAELAPRTVYTLRAEVGNIGSGTALLPPFSGFGFFDLEGFPGYRLQLLAGGVVVAEDVDTVRPDERRWETATLRFTTTSRHPLLGQPLGIRLVNRNRPEVPGVTGIEVDFDEVRLETRPAGILPHPLLLFPIPALSGWLPLAVTAPGALR